MKEVRVLGKRELIALIRELSAVTKVRGRLAKVLREVLREADLSEKLREEKALAAKLRREKRRREQLAAWKEETKHWATQEEIRKKAEEKYNAWVRAHGDSSIETIFGIPVKLETEE